MKWGGLGSRVYHASFMDGHNYSVTDIPAIKPGEVDVALAPGLFR